MKTLAEALEETVKEIKSYSEDELADRLKESEDSDFAKLIDNIMSG